jgi:hypothetical protein
LQEELTKDALPLVSTSQRGPEASLGPVRLTGSVMPDKADGLPLGQQIECSGVRVEATAEQADGVHPRRDLRRRADRLSAPSDFEVPPIAAEEGDRLGEMIPDSAPGFELADGRERSGRSSGSRCPDAPSAGLHSS